MTTSETTRCSRELNVGPTDGSTYLNAPPVPPLSGTLSSPSSLMSRDTVACVTS